MPYCQYYGRFVFTAQKFYRKKNLDWILQKNLVSVLQVYVYKYVVLECITCPIPCILPFFPSVISTFKTDLNFHWVLNLPILSFFIKIAISISRFHYQPSQQDVINTTSRYYHSYRIGWRCNNNKGTYSAHGTETLTIVMRKLWRSLSGLTLFIKKRI